MTDKDRVKFIAR